MSMQMSWVRFLSFSHILAELAEVAVLRMVMYQLQQQQIEKKKKIMDQQRERERLQAQQKKQE